jgi:hypothetical protein
VRGLPAPVIFPKDELPAKDATVGAVVVSVMDDIDTLGADKFVWLITLKAADYTLTSPQETADRHE